MKIKCLFIFCAICFGLFFNVEAQEDAVLFTVDNEPVLTKEFIRVYNKNLDLVKDESQKDIDAYLKLFVNYKLKLRESLLMKLNEKQSYIRELGSYKRQLAKNYLTDNKVTDALVEEAYDHMVHEVKANHLLVLLKENATDTLAAYNEVLKLRDRALKEGYDAVQKDVHNGKTIFAENLGYFTAFRMVYPFEKAGYNTPVGEISMPFRTRFGYHVVQVLDKRKARGEVTVAHIMLKLEGSDSETKINEIYKRLEQGEGFEALAKQFSEDKSSSAKGGLLKPFSGGALSAKIFEDKAFALKNTNELTKPFKSKFGWHIVKLIKKTPLASFKELKPELERKIKKDSRSKIINESHVNDLKKQYTITEDVAGLAYFKSIVNNDYKNRGWKLPFNFTGDKVLFSIEDKAYSYQDFGSYLEKNQRDRDANKTIEAIVNTNYKSYLEKQLLQFQKDNLINENEEYAQIVGEYRDGLLLFDLMESEIWSAAKKDTIALQEFYNNNKAKYFFNKRVKATVASSAKKKHLKKVAKLLSVNKSIEDIKAIVNTNNAVNVSFTTGEMDASHQALPKTFNFKKGLSKITKHNDAYVVVKADDVLPKSQKSFEDAKGQVISDFQNFKETQWLKSLAIKYPVKINDDVLNNIKKSLIK